MSQAADHDARIKKKNQNLFFNVEYVMNNPKEEISTDFFFRYIRDCLDELIDKHKILSEVCLEYNIEAFKAYDAWVIGELNE